MYVFLLLSALNQVAVLKQLCKEKKDVIEEKRSSSKLTLIEYPLYIGLYTWVFLFIKYLALLSGLGALGAFLKFKPIAFACHTELQT